MCELCVRAACVGLWDINVDLINWPFLWLPPRSIAPEPHLWLFRPLAGPTIARPSNSSLLFSYFPSEREIDISSLWSRFMNGVCWAGIARRSGEGSCEELLLQSKHSQNPIISLHLSWKSLTLKRCSRPRSLQRSQRSQLYGTELSGFVRQFTRHYQYSRVHSTWNWEGNQPMT